MQKKAIPVIDVIIPAFNEEHSIAHVIKDIPSNLVRELVVVNNNSTDNTATVASKAGATVLLETNQGYGAACLKGLTHVKNKIDKPDIVVFLDADYSDHPSELPLLIEPIMEQNIDMVIGSRALGKKEKGAMMPQQIFGNWLATSLLKLCYGVRYTDLGPFRAIKWEVLDAINMEDTNYGWTVEMQLKVAKQGYKSTEVAVNYRKRIGKSKIAGTVKGTILAGYKILYTIFKYR